jgi:uncharacterized protein with GYD domain
MATYLVQFSYTEQGAKGVLKEGGSKRRARAATTARRANSKLTWLSLFD